MRRWSSVSAAVTALCVLAGRPAGADDKARELIKSAAEAHGGLDKLAAIKAMRLKVAGTITDMGLTIQFTGNISFVPPDKAREEVEFEVMGQKISMIRIFDGTKGYMVGAGMDGELTDKRLDSLKDTVYVARIDLLAPLLSDNRFELTSLGESKVGDATVAGVKVSSKGRKDVRLYIDVKTHLVLKREHESVDDNGGKYAYSELYFDHKEFNGIKLAGKTKAFKDGRPMMDGRIISAEFPDKLDDKVFAKPEN